MFVKERIMKRTSLTLSIVLALIVWSPFAVAQTQPQPEELAQKAAESWLALTDTGKYAESWEEASSSFKSALTKDGWVAQVAPVRDPLGKVDSRKLSSSSYKSNPPNAPAGEYVILKYSTDFENKNNSTETIVLVLDKDSKWRTAGYWIK
jgi:hypothetical protein